MSPDACIDKQSYGFRYFLFQLVLEGIRARQLQDTLLMNKRTMERELQQASNSLSFYDMKSARIEDQVHS